ncbi:MAG: hypothetical protein AAFW68_00965 [Pseudomonadota bacterium]
MTADPRNPDAAGGGQEKSFGDIAASIGSRNLMIAIVTMPIFFLGLVAAIITLFGRPQTDGDTTATEPQMATEHAPGALMDQAKPDQTMPDPALTDQAPSMPPNPTEIPPLAIAASQTPGAIALDGDRLAVRLDGPEGVVIVVYDLSQREIIARVPITQAEPN